MNNEEVFTQGFVSDNEAVSRVLQGEKDLYAVIMRRHNQRLYRVAMAIINDDAEAEDAMQVAYINAYENLEKFGFKASFATWLTKILINESLLRVKRRAKRSPLTEEIINKNIHQQHMANGSRPDKKVLNTELRTILEKAIQELPEKYRTVFIMREVEGMNVADTKQCLDISEINVKVRLNRAKALLRNALSALYKNDDILHFHLSRCDRVIEIVLARISSI